MRARIYLAIALMLNTLLASAQERLRIGTDESLPPFSFVRSGKAAGIDVDMLRAAAQRLNLDIEIVSLPWKRVLALTESGDLQLAMPLFRTPQREAFAQYTGAVHFSQSGLLIKRGKEFNFSSIDDLHGKRIGISRGFVIEDELDRAIKAGTVTAEEVGSIDQNIRKLLAGRIDAFATNVLSTRYLLRGTPAETETTQLPRLLNENRPAFLVISRKASVPERAKLAAALRSTLDDLHRDGTYARIVDSYLKD